MRKKTLKNKIRSKLISLKQTTRGLIKQNAYKIRKNIRKEVLLE